MMIRIIKKIYSKTVPRFIRKKVQFIRLKNDIKKVRKQHIELVKELKLKKKINVIFLVIHDSIWKYEEVYRLLNENPKFIVNVVVIPLVRDGMGQMETFNQTLDYFQKNGYNTISSYDKKNEEWLDIKSLTKPDIVFFTNPHKLTFDKYYIDEFKEKLTCYVPYAFVVIHSIEMHYNQKVHHLFWKHFVETEYHKNFAKTFSKDNCNNVFVTGYPSLDKKFNIDYKPKTVWKKSSYPTMKIIWAPHHTISGQGAGLDYSSFMEYQKFFVDLLKERKEIQIAFKPHPLLKEKLYNDKSWGKDKTDRYYQTWTEMPNGQLETGEYLDLFYSSDAMIMDSASFIAEYLYFDKPICFTMVDEGVKTRFNTFGQLIFDYLYKAKNIDDIYLFIDQVVKNEEDSLKTERNNFFKEVILPKNKKTASENIYNEIVKELC